MEQTYHPGLENVIACETKLSFLDVEHEEIVIRGYSLIELAKKLKYVDLIGLILQGQLLTAQETADLQQSLVRDYPLPAEIWQILSLLPAQTHLMDALRTGISALAGFDPNLSDQSPEANYARALRLLAQVPQIVANSYHAQAGGPAVAPMPQLSFVGNFLYMITKRIPTPSEESVFDQALMAYAEHEMPNSTFTARVITSTLADMYGAVTGAVASLRGPLHGGANEEVMKMLLEAETPEGMRKLMHAKLDSKARIMGFGHRVYMKRIDPRALLMKEALQQMSERAGDSRLYDMCVIGEEIMKQEKNLYPNLDYYAAPVFHLLGIPIDLFTPVFLAARTLGLGAHVTEQRQNNRLFRPRVLYTGPRGLTI